MDVAAASMCKADSAASAAMATSARESAESFFLSLNAKRDFGANLRRASWNFSFRLLMVCDLLEISVSDRGFYKLWRKSADHKLE